MKVSEGAGQGEAVPALYSTVADAAAWLLGEQPLQHAALGFSSCFLFKMVIYVRYSEEMLPPPFIAEKRSIFIPKVLT
jgi:hypothetical protein